MTVELTGERGVTFSMSEAVEGACLCCGERRDVTVITVAYQNSSPARAAASKDEHRIPVCGRCVLAAVAVRLMAAVIVAEEDPSAVRQE